MSNVFDVGTLGIYHEDPQWRTFYQMIFRRKMNETAIIRSPIEEMKELGEDIIKNPAEWIERLEKLNLCVGPKKFWKEGQIRQNGKENALDTLLLTLRTTYKTSSRDTKLHSTINTKASKTIANFFEAELPGQDTLDKRRGEAALPPYQLTLASLRLTTHQVFLF